MTTLGGDECTTADEVGVMNEVARHLNVNLMGQRHWVSLTGGHQVWQLSLMLTEVCGRAQVMIYGDLLSSSDDENGAE